VPVGNGEIMNKQYKITLLAPVHIGTGEKYTKNIDYFSDGTGTHLIEIEKFFQALTASQINELTNHMNIIEFMERNKIDKTIYKKKKISSMQISAQEINRFIKDSFEIPYIPGSSLKGALRTVIGQRLFKEQKIQFNFSQKSPKEWAYTELNKKIFGKDPNHDFLKGFMVVDSFFEPSDITLQLVKVFTLKGNKKLEVKLTNRDNPNSEMKIYCEFLKDTATSQVKIKIDDFFLAPSVMEKLNISLDRKQSLENLREIANSYAKERIEKELAFYSMQEELKPVTQFYQRLQKTLEERQEDSFILNIGWGTGWGFKTGDYIEDEDLEKVRYRYKLGRIINNSLVKPFPKSRKIIFDTLSSKPCSVPGWIMLTEQ
jgi:CRISPR-associated protein Csm5